MHAAKNDAYLVLATYADEVSVKLSVEDLMQALQAEDLRGEATDEQLITVQAAPNLDNVRIDVSVRDAKGGERTASTRHASQPVSGAPLHDPADGLTATTPTDSSSAVTAAPGSDGKGIYQADVPHVRRGGVYNVTVDISATSPGGHTYARTLIRSVHLVEDPPE
jgi:hypothetical protein